MWIKGSGNARLDLEDLGRVITTVNIVCFSMILYYIYLMCKNIFDVLM